MISCRSTQLMISPTSSHLPFREPESILTFSIQHKHVLQYSYDKSLNRPNVGHVFVRCVSQVDNIRVNVIKPTYLTLTWIRSSKEVKNVTKNLDHLLIQIDFFRF